jgi:16S rRNA (adenine1518-N6/adenine1519-N6)-dimethyltransferase
MRRRVGAPGLQIARASMKLSEIRQILTERDIQLTKSLGQNFLHDGNQLDRITQSAKLCAEDRVLEIGPGLGPLTERLIATAKEVLAIEKDQRLCEVLRDRFRSAANFKLLEDDALLYLRQPRDWSDWKMISNLPYSVASPILVDLAQLPQAPRLMTATLQLEVARRLMAVQDNADYGVLTLLVQLRYQPLGTFKISAGCFFPEPDVDSACVTLERRAEPLLDPALAPFFSRLVKRGFSQRRKMMFKLLKAERPEDRLKEAFGKLGISPQARAEAVSLQQFVELTKLLA